MYAYIACCICLYIFMYLYTLYTYICTGTKVSHLLMVCGLHSQLFFAGRSGQAQAEQARGQRPEASHCHFLRTLANIRINSYSPQEGTIARSVSLPYIIPIGYINSYELL